MTKCHRSTLKGPCPPVVNPRELLPDNMKDRCSQPEGTTPTVQSCYPVVNPRELLPEDMIESVPP
jgi:hypothetical protein